MKIYKYGDNVDTDVIIPARHLNDPDPKALASHCMEDIDKDFAKTVTEVAGAPIQQVVIGSCTNGRIKDLREAAAILKGKKVAGGVRCIVIPATQEIVKECLSEGLVDIFLDAGCAFSTPTCGPCLGGHMGVLAPGERCVSTTNRNFVGRMGDTSSEVILASPAVAAASAVRGCVADPRTL